MHKQSVMIVINHCNAVKPTLKTTCILRPPAYKDHILQASLGVYNFNVIEPAYMGHIYMLVCRVVFIYRFHHSKATQDQQNVVLIHRWSLYTVNTSCT